MPLTMIAPLTDRSEATEIVLRPDAEVDTGGTSCAPVSVGLLFSVVPPIPPIEEQAAASNTKAVAEATLTVFLRFCMSCLQTVELPDVPAAARSGWTPVHDLHVTQGMHYCHPYKH
jgi:hypothetical protein